MNEDSIQSAGPRVTINFGPRLAIDMAFERQLGTRSEGDSFWERVDLVLVQVRRRLVSAGDYAISAAVGGGVGLQAEYFPAQFEHPKNRITKTHGAVFAGIGFERVLASHAAGHVEAQMVWLAEPDLTVPFRVSAGLAFPLGAYTRRRPIERGEPVATWKPGRLRAGGQVWITRTDGAELAGEVLAIRSAEIAVLLDNGAAESVPLSSIRQIEGPDSLRNGTVIGMLIGLGASVVPALLLMEDEDTVPALVSRCGIGAGIGAAAGAFADSLNQGRQTLYQSGSLTIARAPGPGLVFQVRW